MRLIQRLLIPVLFLLETGFSLGAYDVSIFDPASLESTLTSDADLFLPRLMGTASEADLLGSSGHNELAYFSYTRGVLVLESNGQTSEKTLIRFFLDSRGEVLTPLLSRSLNEKTTGGAELSQAYKGGTLYFSRFKANEVRLIREKREIIPLEESPGIYTAHFEAGENYFWLGDGQTYYCYDSRGVIQNKISLNGLLPLGESRALSASAFSSGKICLLLEKGKLFFAGPEQPGRVFENSTDLDNLFVDYYNGALNFIQSERPELVEEYKNWAVRSVEDLFKKDPLNRPLSSLYYSLK